MARRSREDAKTTPAPVPGLISQTDPKSAACEAFRTLLTNIQFAKVDHPCRTVVVTSATPGEGKTTSAANFAAVAAEGGARVCLIDSDLRRPTLHRVFGVENRRGLTTALVEDLPLADVAQPSTVASLSVVTSGPLAPNPAKLVGSHRMRELLDKSAGSFDLVVCDSPPVMSVADGLALSAHCDGVILVVRVGRITHEVLRRTTEQIEGVGGNILGVVLNSVNLRRDGRYYRYYKYYRAAQAYYSGNGKR